MQIKKVQLAAPYLIIITEDFSVIEQRFCKEWNMIKDTIEVEGIEKGQVSRDIAEEKIGKEKLYSKVLDEIFQQAMMQNNINYVSVRSFKVKSFGSETKPFILEVVIDVVPDVVLGEYKGLQVLSDKVVVSNEEVEQEIKKRRFQNVEYISIDQPVDNNHVILVDLTVYLESEKRSMKSEDLRLDLSENALQDFVTNVVGMKKGEEKTFEVKLPKNIDITIPKGIYKMQVYIKDIFEKKYLDNDELSKKFNFDTFDDFKKSIYDEIYKIKSTFARKKVELDLIDKVVKNSTISPIPESMIQQELDIILNSILKDLNLTKEEYFSRMNITRDDFNAQYINSAIQYIKRSLILDKIIELENITVSDDDIKNFYEKEKVDENYDKEYLSAYIQRIKAIDLLVSTAKIIEK